MQNAATIFALSTGATAAALAVLRISGPAAATAVHALTGEPPPRPRMLSLRRFRDPRSGADIDRGLVAWFPGPQSVTGEDVAELHVHGGRAVAEAVLRALAGIEGLRLAEAGEFTRRAFEHGKLDLTQAEAVADLVAAGTEAQREQALRQLDGGLGALYERWRATLIAALSRYEAEIDFSDEDLPDDLIAAVRSDLAALSQELARHLDDERRGEILREGFEIVLVGPPNAGKSSLLNRIAGRDVAIVSQMAGTTRDVIEVSLNLKGYPVILSDTAGLRAARDGLAQDEESIEAEGIKRAIQRAESADLRVIVLDATAPESLTEDVEALSRTHGITVPRAAECLIVLNKADLLGDCQSPQSAVAKPSEPERLLVSALTGAGIDALMASCAERAAAALGRREAPVITRARHRSALGACAAALRRVLEEPQVLGSPELAAEDLRLATHALARITGRVDVEDILDRIFSDFCIGK